MLRVVAGIGTVITGIGAVGSKRTEAADKLLKGSEKLPQPLAGTRYKMKYWKLFLIWGWFFAFQHAWDTDNESVVKGIVGPFPTQAECMKSRDYLEELMNATATAKAQISQKCLERREA